LTAKTNMFVEIESKFVGGHNPHSSILLSGGII
jgi:hypothetical protein